MRGLPPAGAGTALLLALALAAGPVPCGAGVLPLGDDDTVEVVFVTGFSFPFFGEDHTSVFVNSNGSITFGRGDISSLAEEPLFLEGPARIAALWTDLDPSGGGTVSTAENPSSFTVTWNGVPLFGEAAGNTFSITLLPDGSFQIAYGALSAREGIAGYSGGERLTRDGPGAVDLSIQAQPIGNGSRGALHEVFTGASPADLAGAVLSFRATWDRFFFYVPDTSAGGLLKINGWSGSSSEIGPIGFAAVEGLTFAPDGTLYGVDTGRFPLSATLLEIDPETGAGSEIGPLGFPVVHGLAAAPDGTLLGVEMDPDLEETSLLVIDPATGAAAVRAPMNAADVSAMAFTPDGTLYAVDDDTDMLLAVDPATGAETPVGPLRVDGIQGLAAGPEGGLYAVRRELVIGEGFKTVLLEVDPATGAASPIGGPGPGAAGGLAARCETSNGGMELCDGLDNDCDGEVDEDFPGLGGTCTSGLGECARTGTLGCSLDGGSTVCSAVPGEPTAEICNGLDDDCDGDVEDDLDEDGDGLSICGGDCDDSLPGSRLLPGEVTGLLFRSGWLVWDDLAAEAGDATRYDVAADLSPDFAGAQCLYPDLADPTVEDQTPAPSPPAVLYLLVRAENGCGRGAFGRRSDGAPRQADPGDCP